MDLKNIILTLIVLTNSCLLLGQGNCLLYKESSGERKACELAKKAIQYPQGSRESQTLFDKAIAISPKYAWAYYEKSVPYFKRGLPNEGLKILNKAVELEPQNYLYFRACWYYEYQNYKNCLADLERFFSLTKADYTYTPSGETKMKMIFAMANARLGDFSEAIKIIETLMNSYKSESDIDLRDYHTLGIIQLLDGQYEKAILSFKKQLKIDEYFADTYYYLGEAYMKIGQYENAKKEYLLALEFYEKGYTENSYAFPVTMDEINRAYEKLLKQLNYSND